jgi:Tfp pilus assembly protein PilO
VAPIRTIAREWLPAAAGVASVVLTGLYAVTRQSRAAARIQAAETVSSELTSAADKAQATVLPSEKARQVQARREELEQRMKEAREPGLVQAGLMDSARRAGLDVREAQPWTNPKGSREKDAAAPCPAYRVSVQGTYPQIGEYLKALAWERLPARVVELRMIPVADAEGKPTKLLRAEVTVEAFQPAPAGRQEGPEGP